MCYVLWYKVQTLLPCSWIWSISPWLRLDSGLWSRSQRSPNCPRRWSPVITMETPGDATLRSEDYQNKLDTIYPFVSSLAHLPYPDPLPNMITKDYAKICSEQNPDRCVHIMTSLSLVSNDWSWFSHELPMTEVWQRESDFVWGWPRQNSLTRKFVKQRIWFVYLDRDRIIFLYNYLCVQLLSWISFRKSSRFHRSTYLIC